MNRRALLCGASGVLILLHGLVHPFDAYAAFFAVAACLPGLLFARKDAVTANLTAFGDGLTAFPLLIAAGLDTSGLATFAVTHALLRQWIGGRLLYRSGIGTEKNFTLILAYRQTLAHCHRFPQEVHPRENPLFEPARRAQMALLELLPALGLILAMLLRAGGCTFALPMRWIALPLALVSLARMLPESLPKRWPMMLTWRTILMRMALPALVCAFRPELLLIAAAPPVLTLPEDLQNAMTEDIAEAARWCRLIWLIGLLLYIAKATGF